MGFVKNVEEVISMPRGDGTGPMGMGPLTGRGMGYCVGVNQAFGLGRGFRRGLGRGFGWRGNNYFPVPAPDAKNEAIYLREEAKALEEEIKQINQRLKELDQ